MPFLSHASESGYGPLFFEEVPKPRDAFSALFCVVLGPSWVSLGVVWGPSWVLVGFLAIADAMPATVVHVIHVYVYEKT